MQDLSLNSGHEAGAGDSCRILFGRPREEEDQPCACEGVAELQQDNTQGCSLIFFIHLVEDDAEFLQLRKLNLSHVHLD